jgi:type 1 glutamine amidotransferase
MLKNVRPQMRLGLALVFLLTLTYGAAARAAVTGPAQPPRRVKVLFLGDGGHHHPLERARQAFSMLGRRGIDLYYTDRVADLNPQTLSRYDCLLLYANIERIAPEQERALLDYVAAGHGFVPVHCASFCFQNSPELTALTGARFKSHGVGKFAETFAAAEHPLLKGLRPIESVDESYVHEMHNEKERTVLSYRVEGDRKEPYTWTRTHGKGRVFYTAWGHDQQTWSNADFQNLLERGVRWAAGDWAVAPATVAEPFKYAEATFEIPNYLPDQPWGTEGARITQMQEPASPDQSVRHMVLPPGFAATLVASEPDIMKPICMAWDERGRMWIAETFDYPNEMQPAGKGNDRITICEDTDRDGRADKFTLFADKLSIPTGICFANGGLIVAQAPDMLFLKDTDGDGKADVRKVLFTGWGTDDTHAGPSNLRYGFDNWVYGAIGYSGFKGTVGGQAVSFGQGLFTSLTATTSPCEASSPAGSRRWPTAPASGPPPIRSARWTTTAATPPPPATPSTPPAASRRSSGTASRSSRNPPPTSSGSSRSSRSARTSRRGTTSTSSPATTSGRRR